MDLYILITAALFNAAVTFTIAMTSIFKPLRIIFTKIHPKLGEWIGCPWCLSLYPSLFLAYNPMNYYPYMWMNYVITIGAIWGLTGIIHYILLRSYRPVTEEKVRQKIEELKKTVKKNA